MKEHKLTFQISLREDLLLEKDLNVEELVIKMIKIAEDNIKEAISEKIKELKNEKNKNI